jgi:hypothetical protein
MNEEERHQVLTELVASEGRVLGLVSGLTAQQWAFRDTAGSQPVRWSIAEIVEHLALFERFIAGAIASAMALPCDLARKERAAELSERNEGLVLGLASTRTTQQFKAREATTPTGRWTEPEELIAEFRKARAESVTFVQQMRGNPRDFFFAHIAFGDLDCYQWLLLLSTHTDRHALQIEEVMRDAAFPT